MRKPHHALALCLFLLCFAGSIRWVFSGSDEKEILLHFKGNVTDDPYGSLGSWVVGGDPCTSYAGVSCDSDGFVEKIVLWNTSLTGRLSPSLSRLERLRVLTLFGNSFSGHIPKEYGDLQRLWKINFSSNALSGSIPGFIGGLPNIRLLDLSRNMFSGEVPEALFDRCLKTKFVALSHNALSGPVPGTLPRCSNLEGFDFSSNALTGEIPRGLCDIPRLDHVSLGGNTMSGSVSDELSRCLSLRVLDLGGNSFTGPAPLSVLGSVNLTRLNVSFNRFTGRIPDVTACSERLEILDASWNSLDGEVPAGVSSCKGLKILNLGYNKLSGKIPTELVKLERLLVIQLGNNSISGEIPKELAAIQLLQVLDLHNLNLVGEIPADIANSIFLRGLDVSGNSLEGPIPEALYNMTYLEILDLHRNRLTGTVPPSLGSLSRLQILDLSYNSLSGPIPSSLGNLSALTSLNLSSNNLSGTIPVTIRRFGASAFVDNPFLCGDPLEDSKSCSGTSDGTKTAASNRKKKHPLTVSAIVAIVAAAAILAGVCLVSVMNVAARRKKREVEPTVSESTPLASSDLNIIIGKLVLFSKSLPSKYEDWESGTNALLDKECMIGGGSIGTVYKTSFEGGVSIAVKKLETLGRIRTQDEFEQEIGRLGNLRHPNLVALQGYYWSSTMQLILSEFVPNGNLYDNLHGLHYPGTSTGGGNSELDWPRRFEIALGTARALAYLHHDCQPPILHLNIKSTNILLDETYKCKLSDYGLGKLLPILDNHGLTKSHSAVGYVAPELAQSLRSSEKCDVYGLGVILLELVTGRRPVESPRGNGVVVLCDYVRESLGTNSASNCFDRGLRGIVENELIQVMKLGLICTSELPSKRPSMAEVVQFLESVRNGTSESDPNHSSTSN